MTREAVQETKRSADAANAANVRADRNIKIAEDNLAHAQRVAESGDKSAEKSLSLTRKSNEAAQRAWLSVKGVGSGPLIAPGSYGEVDIDIENTGRSPAQKIRMITAATAQPPNWFFTDQITRPTHRHINLAPMGPNQVQAIPIKRPAPFTEIGIQIINRGTPMLYYGGWLVYADSFSDSRELGFCF